MLTYVSGVGSAAVDARELGHQGGLDAAALVFVRVLREELPVDEVADSGDFVGEGGAVRPLAVHLADVAEVGVQGL